MSVSIVSFILRFIPIDLHHFIQFILKSRKDSTNSRSISITSIKRVSKVSATKKTGNTIEGTISTNEMDSHADTCVAGKNWNVMSYSDVVCEVSPFTDEYESIKEVPIVLPTGSIVDIVVSKKEL